MTTLSHDTYYQIFYFYFYAIIRLLWGFLVGAPITMC